MVAIIERITTVSGRPLSRWPAVVMTDKYQSSTVEHVAGIPVRTRQMVALASPCGVLVKTCVPGDVQRPKPRTGQSRSLLPC